MSRKSGWISAIGLAFILVLAFSRGSVAEENGNARQPHGADTGSNPAVVSAPGVTVALHAAVHFDYVAFDNNEEYIKGAGSQENTLLTKRARISVKAKVHDTVTLYVQGAFDVPNTPILDAQVSIAAARWLDLQAGLMKMPFSAERLRGYASRQPFMERSLMDKLNLRRSQGGMLDIHPFDGAVDLYLGCFTGENMLTANTDDDFEYTGRVVWRLNKTWSAFPGAADLGFSYTRGKRTPINGATSSFSGKTMNGLTFFSPIPVNGYRTRWSADAEWRVKSLWFAGQMISSQEERQGVTVNLRAAGAPDVATDRHLDPLDELGWMAYGVWVITGENAAANLQPSRSWGALELAVRYSSISFDSGNKWVRSDTGVLGREVSTASTALGRSSINEGVRDLYVGLNWIIKPGVFFDAAAVWQWFDYSSPFEDGNGHADINYRARVGVAF